MVLLNCFGCAGRGRDKPNILFLLVDSLRSDHLGLTGYPRPTSPCLDSLASAGVAFTSCIAQAPFTMPSVASMLTGLYPSSAVYWTDIHVPGKARSGPAVALGRGVSCIPLILRPHGYVSAAFETNPNVGHRILGLRHQFNHFDGSLEGCWYKDSAERVNQQALRWLCSADVERWFCLIHYMDVHLPYQPPRDFARRYLKSSGNFPVVDAAWLREQARDGHLTPQELERVVALYDGAVTYLDAQVCILLDMLEGLPASENMLVVVASDHGDEFMEHDYVGHGHSLHEELIRCPLVLSWNGHLRGGRVCEVPVQNIDIVPTILDLIGVAVPEAVEGRSLTPLMSGPPSRLPAMSEMQGVSVRRGRWELWLRSSGEESLYDVVSDPLEQEDLVQVLPDTAQSLERQIEAWRSTLVKAQRPSLPDTDTVLDLEVARLLRKLGYLE